MACISNLVALLNFTTTCQCHFWSTISVDGFTSQVACTWMIQMTLNGVSQKQKIGHLMGHYMIPHHVSYIFSLDLYYMVQNILESLKKILQPVPKLSSGNRRGKDRRTDGHSTAEFFGDHHIIPHH